MFNVDSREGLKFFKRSRLGLRLGMSHLVDNKFRHNFQDCLNPVFSGRKEIENPFHETFKTSLFI